MAVPACECGRDPSGVLAPPPLYEARLRGVGGACVCVWIAYYGGRGAGGRALRASVRSCRCGLALVRELASYGPFYPPDLPLRAPLISISLSSLPPFAFIFDHPTLFHPFIHYTSISYRYCSFLLVYLALCLLKPLHARAAARTPTGAHGTPPQ